MEQAVLQGRKGGSEKQHTPVEEKNNLLSKSIAKVLLAIGEGEFAGTPRAEDIFLDGTPLTSAGGLENFGGVTWDYRSGRSDQTYIAGMPDVSNEFSVAYELTDEQPWTRFVSDSQLDAIRITFAWPALYQQQENGDITGYNIEYAIDVSTDGGAYVEYGKFDTNSGKTNVEYDRTHRVTLPRPGSNWTIRVRRITPNKRTSKYADAMTIKSFAEVIDAKLRYPNTALLYVAFDAETFGGSSIPKVSVKIKGRLIQVPSNYNPTARAYDGVWNGTFKWAWSDNPAWVFYDLVTNERFGLGARIKADMVDKWTLYQVAQYCDVLVSDGKGGQEPRYTCNIYIQSRKEAWQVLRDIVAIFNGMLHWSGTQIVATADMPVATNTVRTYNRSNVIDGKFTYGSTSEKTIATTALVSYDDPENHFETSVEAVNDLTLVQRYKTWNQAEIAAMGTTSRGQAQRKGKYQMLTNSLNRVVTFKLGMEGYLPRPGEVFGVADQVLAGSGFSGRISASTQKTVTCDREPNAAAGDILYVNNADGTTSEGRTIQSVNGKVITVTTNFTATPVVELGWYVEKTTLKSQLYRATKVTWSDNDGKFEVTGVQYEESKYAAVDNGARLETRPITNVPAGGQDAPTGLTLSSYSFIEQTMAVTTLSVSWNRAPGAMNYEAQWRKDGGDWINVGRTTSTGFDVKGIYKGAYQARVRALNVYGSASVWATSDNTDMNGKEGAPPVPATLTAESLLFGIALKWTFPSGAEDTSRTELWYNTIPDLATATKLADLAYPQSDYTMQGLRAGQQFFFWARLVDKSENIGEFYPGNGMTVMGQASSDAGAILEQITDSISKSELGQELLGDINRITDDSPGSVNDRINQAKEILSDQITEVAGNLAQVDADVTGINNSITDIKQQVVDLNNELDADIAGVNTQLTNVNTSITNLNTTLTNQINTAKSDLQASINTVDARNTLPWKNTGTYAVGQMVQYTNGKLYRAKQAVPANTVPTNTTYWLDIGDIVATTDGLAARVSTAESNITNLDGKITAQSTRIDGVQTQVNGKADATALTNLTTRVTTAEGKIDSQGTAITGLQTTVNGKADTSALNSLTTRVTTAEGKIDANTSSLTNLSATVGNIAGNGANLLPAEYTIFDLAVPSMVVSGASAASEADAAAFTGYALKVTTASTSTTAVVTLASAQTYAAANLSMVKGKWIVSYYARSTTAGHQVGAYLRTAQSDGTSVNTGAGLVALTTAWARYSMVLDTTGTSFVGDKMYLFLQPNRSGVASRVVYFDRIMVEPMIGTGTTPSPFTPGTSYTQSLANANATQALTVRVNKTETDISTQATQITNLNTSLANKADGSAVTALTTRVTNVEGAITSQGESITKLNSSLNTAGGENLLYNPSFEKESTTVGAADGWWYDGSAGTRSVSLVASTLDPNGLAQRGDFAGLTATTWFRIYSKSDKRIKLSTGTTYTYSMYVKATVGVKVRPQVYGVNAAGSATTSFSPTGYTDGTGDWQRMSVTFTAPAGTDSVYVSAVVYGTASIGTGFIEVDKVQLEVGDIVTGWRDNNGVTDVAVTANATATQALTTRVSNAEGQITSQGTAITSLNSTVDNIAGTGANMLPAEYSAFNDTAPVTSTNAGYTIAVEADVAAYSGYALKVTTNNTSAGTAMYFVPSLAASVNYSHANMGFKRGKYILSYYARASVAGHTIAPFLKTISPDNTSVNSVIVSQQQALTTTWARYSAVVDMTSATHVGDLQMLSLQTNVSGVTGRSFWLDRIMLEPQIGNNATPSAFNLGNSYLQTKANATATQSLTTRVTNAEGNITSQGQAITNLTNTVSGKADASAVTALATRVTAVEGSVTSQSQNITTLNNNLTRSLNNSPTKVYQSVFGAMANDQWVSIASTTTATAVYGTQDGSTNSGVLVLSGGASNGHWWGESTSRVRFDPARLYKLSARVQQVSVSLASPATYLGLNCYAEDGITRINNTGANSVSSQHYVLMNNSINAVGQWVEVSVYVKGHTTSTENGGAGAGTTADPKRLKAGTAWFSPMVIANYNSKGGVSVLDYFAIEDVTEQVQIDANASATSALTTRVTNAEGTITSQGQSITSLSNTVSGKADSSAVSSLTNRVTAVEGTVTSQGQSITSLNSSVNAIAGNGTNLMPSEFSVFSAIPPVTTAINTGLTYTTVADSACQNGYALKFTSSVATNSLACYLHASNTTADGWNLSYENAKYIISFYAKANADGRQIRAYLRALNSSDVAVNPTSTLFTLTTSWVRYSAVVDLTNATTFSGNRATFALMPNNSGVSGTEVYFDRIMVEKQVGNGTAPSTYNAGSSYTQAASQGSALQSLTTRVTTAEGSLTSQSTSLTNLQASIGTFASDNMLLDPTFTGTVAQTNTSAVAMDRNASGVPAGAPSSRVLKWTVPTGTANLYMGMVVNPNVRSPENPILWSASVAAGEVYDFEIYVNSTVARQQGIWIQMYDSANTSIAHDWVTASGDGVRVTTAVGTWTKLTGTRTIPAGVIRMAMTFRFTAGDAGDAFISSPVMRKRASQDNSLASATSSLDARVTTAEGTITSQGSSITNLTASVNGIGGTGSNLMPAEYSTFTDTLPAIQKRGTTTVTAEAYTPAYQTHRLKVVDTEISAGYICLYENNNTLNLRLKPSQKYIFSCWAEVPVARNLAVRIRYVNSAGTQVEVGIGTITIGTTWGRYSAVCTTPAAVIDRAELLLFTVPATGSMESYFDSFMLEEAIGANTTPSSFTPGTSTNQIKGQASATSALTARVAANEAGLTSQSNSITQLDNNIGDSGGENLLYNPVFRTGTGAMPVDGWVDEGAATSTNTTVTSWMNSGENAVRMAMSGLTTTVYKSLRNDATRRIKVSAGQPVTASIYAKADAANVSIRFFMQFLNAAGTVVSAPANLASTLTTTATRYTLQATAPTGAVEGYIYYRMYGLTTTAATAAVELARPQVEYGFRATGWRNNGQTAATDQSAISSAVNALTSAVNTQGNTITSQGQSITSLNNSITAIGGGGTNLLSDEYSWLTSTTLPTMNASGSTAVGVAVAGSASGFGMKFTSTSTSVTAWHMLCPTNNAAGWNIPVEIGNYIVSFYASCPTSAKVQIRLYSAASAYSTQSITTTTTRTRYSVIVPFASVSQVAILFYYNQLGVSGTEVTVDSVMIEKQIGNGTDASPFVAGPSARSVTAQATAMTALTNRVSNAEGTLSSQASSITNLSSTLQSIGGAGINLLPDDYSWLTSTTLPPITLGSATATGVAVPESMSGYGITVSSTSSAGQFAAIYLASTAGVAGTNMQLDPGVYIVSMYVKGSTAGTALFNLYDMTTSATAVVPYTTTRTRVSGTITIPKTSKVALLLYPNYHLGSTANMTVDSIMVEKYVAGTTNPSPFTPGASARALSSLTTTVTQQGSTITSQAQSISGLQTTVGNNTASIQQLSTTTTNTNNSINASWSVKLMTMSNGQQVTAGFGLGLGSVGGVTQSTFAVSADRFAVLNSNLSGALTTPFAVVGGVTYLSDAFIRNASITNAKIGGIIQSDAVDGYGRPLWSINKSGSMELNSTNSQYRRDMRANYDRYWYLPTGVLVIEIGELS